MPAVGNSPTHRPSPALLQVDFSQSVHHLWKQFRRFGRKGNADLGQQAEGHQRQGPPGGKFEIKADLLSGGRARGGGGGGGGGGYALLLDDDAGGRPEVSLGCWSRRLEPMRCAPAGRCGCAV